MAEIILHHHERLDGSGYPRGLKGDAILREAQILAVADVVEAMSYSARVGWACRWHWPRSSAAAEPHYAHGARGRLPAPFGEKNYQFPP